MACGQCYCISLKFLPHAVVHIVLRMTVLSDSRLHIIYYLKGNVSWYRCIEYQDKSILNIGRLVLILIEEIYSKYRLSILKNSVRYAKTFFHRSVCTCNYILLCWYWYFFVKKIKIKFAAISHTSTSMKSYTILTLIRTLRIKSLLQDLYSYTKIKHFLQLCRDV